MQTSLLVIASLVSIAAVPVGAETAYSVHAAGFVTYTYTEDPSRVCSVPTVVDLVLSDGEAHLGLVSGPATGTDVWCPLEAGFSDVLTTETEWDHLEVEQDTSTGRTTYTMTKWIFIEDDLGGTTRVSLRVILTVPSGSSGTLHFHVDSLVSNYAGDGDLPFTVTSL